MLVVVVDGTGATSASGSIDWLGPHAATINAIAVVPNSATRRYVMRPQDHCTRRSRSDPDTVRRPRSRDGNRPTALAPKRAGAFKSVTRAAVRPSAVLGNRVTEPVFGGTPILWVGRVLWDGPPFVYVPDLGG